MSTPPITGRAIWFFGSNVANAGISFMTMILLARALSPVEYGVLAIYFTYTSVLTAFMGLSLDGSVSITYFRRTPAELRQHVGSSIVLICLLLIAVFVLVALFSVVLGNWLKLTLDWLLLGALCASTQAISNIKLVLWMVKGAAKRYAIFQISQGVALTVLSLALVYETQMGWKGRAWALVVINVIFSCSALFAMFNDDECTYRFSLKEMRLALGFGIPLIPHVFGAILFTSVDRFLVNGLLGTASTGLYQLAAQIGSIVMVATDAINKAFSPWLYRHLNASTAAVRKNIVKLTYGYFVTAIAVSAFFFIIPLNFGELFGGKNYSAAGTLVPFFILGHCIGGMYFMVVNYIFYSGRTGYLSFATLISGLIGIFASYILIGDFGILGAAIAFVMSKLLHFLATWLISSKIYPMPWIPRSFLATVD